MWSMIALLVVSPGYSALASQEIADAKVLAVTLDNLLFMPEKYNLKLVQTRGELDVDASRRGAGSLGAMVYTLRGSLGGRLIIKPASQTAQAWTEFAPRWVGREIEVTGLVSLTRPESSPDALPPLTDPDTGGAAIYIVVSAFFGPPDEREHRRPSGDVTLGDLIASSGRLEGTLVTAVGQFRGANLFGDLPAASRHGASDWVIKDGPSAVWVTGKKPQGDGWRLDPRAESESSRWLRVTGRVAASNGVVTLRAVSVVLTRDPSADARPLP